MKIALVHDHLAQDGGAEMVLRVLMEIFPDAPIYTLFYNKDNIKKYYSNRHIEVSIIQKIPFGAKHYRWFLPIMPMAIEFFDLRNFDLVFSDSASFAKGVITSPDTLHISYCHTPTRYLWSDTHQYINDLKYNKYFKKLIAFALNYTRIWDKLASDRVDTYLTNSLTSLNRIRKYYKREAKIIYPPVELDKFYISKNQEDYFLAGCRLVPYKKIDLLIEVFKRIKLKLKIFGDGEDMKRLRKIAGGAKNIEFLGRVSDKEKARLYSKCKAFLNPQKEDFGITAVEAMASGRPVIAFRKGGAVETIIENKTGLFFDEQNADSLIKAIKKIDSIDFNPQAIREHSENFSVEEFKKQINIFIKEEYEKFKNKLNSIS